MLGVGVAAAIVLASPQIEMRAVLGTGVSCRASPADTAAVVAGLGVEDVVTVEGRSEDAAGLVWLRVRAPRAYGPCWVVERLTTAFDRSVPTEALLVVADHVLSSRGGRPVDGFVRVWNLFEDDVHSWAREAQVGTSPVLSLRRAERVGAVLDRVRRPDVLRDPLLHAFVLSLGPMVRYFEPGGLWHVTRAHYRSLHERFADTAWAEELLWAAARQPRYDDCEGNTDCYLGRPLESVATYWTVYPDGRFVDEAIGIGASQLAGLPYCEAIHRSTPVTPGVLQELRDTLGPVDDARAEPLLDRLAAIEAGCS